MQLVDIGGLFHLENGVQLAVKLKSVVSLYMVESVIGHLDQGVQDAPTLLLEDIQQKLACIEWLL